MKKFLFCLAILLIMAFAASAEGIKLRLGKAAYLRYELVDMYCEYTGPMLDINGASDKIRSAAVCTAKIFCDNRQVTTVGARTRLLFPMTLPQRDGPASGRFPGTRSSAITGPSSIFRAARKNSPEPLIFP